MKFKPKLTHLWWILLLIFVGIGWSMKGNNNIEEWMTLYLFMVLSNLVFACLWVIEREKKNEILDRYVDHEIRERVRDFLG